MGIRVMFFLALLFGTAAANDVAVKPRLFVLSDMTSIESGVLEPDDGESLVRLLLYADVLDIEGLGASSNLMHGVRTRPDLFLQAIDAYAHDLPKLRRHDPAFPDAEKLRACVHPGQPLAERDVPVEKSIGHGMETDLSRAIVAAVDRDDPRPLWISIWGGSADLAQALWTVRETRTPEQLAQFIAKIRVHSSGDQDSTGPWIRHEFPTLFYITRTIGPRGMYRDGDTSLVNTTWVEKNVKGHGALGDLYPIYNGGDRWSSTLGKVQGIKEGDTPCFLNLLGRDPMNGWGGHIVVVEGNHYDDAPVKDAPTTDIAPELAGVYRHRAEFQADFAKRLTWCQ